jgi:hypothetical protein
MPNTIAAVVLAFTAALLASLAPAAEAQGFAAVVSPPRFELAAKPGERTRHVVEIGNASPQSAAFHVRTADWSFDSDDSVVFKDALEPGSCRPWVAIERRDVVVPGGGNYRYRFEIMPPADAPAGECRFALMIEGDEQSVKPSGGAALVVAGRIGVIVYAALGGAAPRLEVVGARVVTKNGDLVPVIEVRNSGNAHGRISGFLSGTDASGRSLEFSPSTLPVLPGETRTLELAARREGDTPIKIAYPITIRGKLEWGDQTAPFEQRFAP